MDENENFQVSIFSRGFIFVHDLFACNSRIKFRAFGVCARILSARNFIRIKVCLCWMERCKVFYFFLLRRQIKIEEFSRSVPCSDESQRLQIRTIWRMLEVADLSVFHQHCNKFCKIIREKFFMLVFQNLCTIFWYS